MAIEVHDSIRAVLITEVSIIWTDHRGFHVKTFRVSGKRPIALWNRELRRLEKGAMQKKTCLERVAYSYGEELELRLDDSQPTREQRSRVIEVIEKVLTDITGQRCFIRRQR